MIIWGTLEVPELCGFWRYLGLGDLKMIPVVILCCQNEFKHIEKGAGQRCQSLAADIMDGHVFFNNFLLCS